MITLVSDKLNTLTTKHRWQKCVVATQFHFTQHLSSQANWIQLGTGNNNNMYDFMEKISREKFIDINGQICLSLNWFLHSNVFFLEIAETVKILLLKNN